MVSGLMVFAAGLPITIIGVAVAMFVEGAMVAVFGLIWTNTLQEMVPRELLGRVSSIDILGSYVLLPIGYGLTGVLTDHIGASLTFMLGGAIGTGLLVLGFLHPDVRRLD